MQEILLRNIVDIVTGRDCKAETYDGRRRLIRITDILPYNRLGEELVSPATEIVNEIAMGDILLPRTGNRMIPYLQQETAISSFASFLLRIRAGKDVSADSLYYQLCSRRFQKWIQTARNDRNITIKIVGAYPAFINKNLQLNKLYLSEMSIRQQIEVIKMYKEYKYKLIRQIFFEAPNTTIGSLCKRIPSTTPTNDGKTPIYQIEGISGYTLKTGNKQITLGIQRNGVSAQVIVIPEGALPGPSIEGLSPLIVWYPLCLILQGAGLDRFLTAGPVPHLYYRNIKDIPCRYTGNEDCSIFQKLEKSIQENEKLLKCMELYHEKLLDEAFPQTSNYN